MSESLKFDQQLTGWHQNKIKGGIAEVACRAHFEALGYAVEGTGIEQIAPQFSKLNGYQQGSYIGNVKELQNLPDFLISRRYKHGSSDPAKADGVFIEAKYRTEVIFEDFTNEILTNYNNLIEKRIHFIVYLVCKRHKDKKSSPEYSREGLVFLNFFNPDISKTNGDTGWQRAGKWDGFSKFPLYQGTQAGQDFNSAYLEIVEPVLKEMLA